MGITVPLNSLKILECLGISSPLAHLLTNLLKRDARERMEFDSFFHHPFLVSQTTFLVKGTVLLFGEFHGKLNSLSANHFYFCVKKFMRSRSLYKRATKFNKMKQNDSKRKSYKA